MEEKDKDSDLQKIEKLIVLMKTNNLAEIEITHGDDKILLRRAGAQTEVISRQGVAQRPAGNDSSDEDLEVIKSPTPGIFYASLGSDSNPYVEIGSNVTPQTIVCIIEAMKVMNQINAGITGQIVEILVENGQAIEYGQPLFKVKSK